MQLTVQENACNCSLSGRENSHNYRNNGFCIHADFAKLVDHGVASLLLVDKKKGNA